MLNQSTLFTSYPVKSALPQNDQQLEQLWDSINAHGYCLLRNYSTNLGSFSQLVRTMCRTVTLDPARANSENAIQKVDAGTAALGLHIENGNTPNAPQLVFFYCKQAPESGSQTTLCDGIKLLAELSGEMRNLFNQKLYVSRTISEKHWKTYLVSEHPLLSSENQVTHGHLTEMLASRPNIDGTLNEDNSLSYVLTINPILRSNLIGQKAFANALLGPSFSYEAPIYKFEDGTPVNHELKETIANLAEKHTLEIPWMNGDIAIIDNHRVMHGRREITDSSSRELFIGMGNL